MSDRPIRTRDGRPTAWWDKTATRRIEHTICPAKPAKTVYLALCEIASNHQSDDFTATLHEIGNASSIHSRRLLIDILKNLEFHGLIDVDRSEFHTANSYRLLEVEPPAKKS